MASTSVPPPVSVVLYATTHHCIITPRAHLPGGDTRDLLVAARFDAGEDSQIDDITERTQLTGALAACITRRAPLWVPDPRVLRSGDDVRAVQALLHQHGLYLIAGSYPLHWTAASDQVEAATRQAIDRIHELRVAVVATYPQVMHPVEQAEAELWSLSQPQAPVDATDLQAEHDAWEATALHRMREEPMVGWHLIVLAAQCQLGQRAPQLAAAGAPWPARERSYARLAAWMLDHVPGSTQEVVAEYLTYRGARTVRGKPYTQALVSVLLRKYPTAGVRR